MIKRLSVSEQRLFLCSSFSSSAYFFSVTICWEHETLDGTWCHPPLLPLSFSLKWVKCPLRLQQFLLFRFLMLWPQRWDQRGLGIKLSSAQWSSCSSELMVGCLIPSPCILHSRDDAEDEPWEKETQRLCQDTSSARCQRGWETPQLLVGA